MRTEDQYLALEETIRRLINMIGEIRQMAFEHHARVASLQFELKQERSSARAAHARLVELLASIRSNNYTLRRALVAKCDADGIGLENGIGKVDSADLYYLNFLPRDRSLL